MRTAAQSRKADPARSRIAQQAGFTVLEALLALTVLVVGLVSFGSLAGETLDGGMVSRHVNAASNLARDKMEELRATPYAGLAPGSDPADLTAEGTTTGAKAIYARSWTVNGGPTANTKHVTVTIAWGHGTKARSVELETIILDW